jgi:Transglycosylase SLT domain
MRSVPVSEDGGGATSGAGGLVGTVTRIGAQGLGAKFGIAAAVVAVIGMGMAGMFFASGSSTAQIGGCQLAGGSAKGVPANYVPWLTKAATKYKLGPRGFAIVAAIHFVESDFGRSPLPGVARGTQNEVGAEGPGQFLVPSWEEFGQDADGDGVKDVYGIPDSIYGTANYMHLSGAPQDWWGAIFAYNHAGWYVEEVLEKAKEFESTVQISCTEPSIGGGEKTLSRVEQVAKWIESRRIHYCWAGGHGPKPGPSEGTGEFCPPGTKGLDCSGSVRWLLVLSGYPDPGGLRSDALGAHYPNGPGRWLTIWANVDHVFVTINGRDWGTSETNFAHGPGFAEHSKEGFVASHPEGL